MIDECSDLQKEKDDTANIEDDLLLIGVDNKSDEDCLFEEKIYKRDLKKENKEKYKN